MGWDDGCGLERAGQADESMDISQLGTSRRLAREPPKATGQQASKLMSDEWAGPQAEADGGRGRVSLPSTRM